MRKTRLTALAVAAILLGGAFGERAEAMTLAPPSALGVATAHAGLVQKATVVCGMNGCAPVQTRRLQKHQLPKPTHSSS
jgi:hypothetical protein